MVSVTDIQFHVLENSHIVWPKFINCPMQMFSAKLALEPSNQIRELYVYKIYDITYSWLDINFYADWLKSGDFNRLFFK